MVSPEKYAARELTLNLVDEWPAIRRLFRKSFASSLHFTIVSVSADGSPHASPIGSLVLDPETSKGTYFEVFSTGLAKNLQTNRNVCVLAVNSGLRFWVSSLFTGKFREMPAPRLYGTVSDRREATPDEIQRWNKKIRNLMWLKGARALWGNVRYVREIHFTRAEKVRLGKLTA